MCNFNKQNEETKTLIHLFMKKCAEAVGGANFLLGMIETLRSTKPHPLTTNKCIIENPNVQIKWNKVIFKDKLLTLENIMILHKSSQDIDFDILDVESQKKRKNIFNMVKTLAPIEFLVTPKDPENGTGFSFKVFDESEDETVKLNPIFMTMFFCSTDFTKKALKYDIES